MTQISLKREHNTILAVTIGSILEWYEIYLFVYWSPILSQLFFDHSSRIYNLMDTFLLFGIGFLARPFGGLIFGRIGDIIGRKKSLILSIFVMIFPTVIMGLLPTYTQIGIYAPIFLVILRFIQAIPAGGELPGAFCYLYENTAPAHRRYMTSWGAVGQQIGIMISMLECFFLEKFLSPEDLHSWGWRVSFLVGGLIGLFGFYIRHKLKETLLFKELEYHHHKEKHSVFQVVMRHKGKIMFGVLFCLLNSVGFYLISVLFPVFFRDLLKINYTTNLQISLFLLAITTIPLPLIGMLGDRWNNKKMLIFSTIAIILLLYPMYLAVIESSLVFSISVAIIFILFFACITALIPFRFADLFSTSERFTCVGVSYNIVDGIFGGFTPFLALYLYNREGGPEIIYWLLLGVALISLFSYFKIQERGV